MTSRIVEVATGVQSEALSERIRIDYDPINEVAGISFESARFLKTEDGYIARQGGDTGLYISLDQLKTVTLAVGGKEITGEEVNQFVRLLYHGMYEGEISFADSEEVPE